MQPITEEQEQMLRDLQVPRRQNLLNDWELRFVQDLQHRQRKLRDDNKILHLTFAQDQKLWDIWEKGTANG